MRRPMRQHLLAVFFQRLVEIRVALTIGISLTAAGKITSSTLAPNSISQPRSVTSDRILAGLIQQRACRSPITIELLAKIAGCEHSFGILPEDSLALIEKPIVIKEYSNGQGRSRSNKTQSL
jgi:hypothetical protein